MKIKVKIKAEGPDAKKFLSSGLAGISPQTLPKGQKPKQDYRGKKDNGNGTVTYT